MALIAKMKSGQPEPRTCNSLLETVVKEHTRYLVATCKGLCKDYGLWCGEAADLFQSTICKVATSHPSQWPPLDSSAAVTQWLRAVARNCLRDKQRSLNRRARMEREYGLEAAKRMIRAGGDEAFGEELHDAFRDAIEGHLSNRMRAVVQLRLEKVPWVEIARRLQISLRTATRAFEAAKNNLRAALVEEVES
jgi:RNA polymerase sigma factor (sigma-70 family)